MANRSLPTIHSVHGGAGSACNAYQHMLRGYIAEFDGKGAPKAASNEEAVAYATRRLAWNDDIRLFRRLCKDEMKEAKKKAELEGWEQWL